MAWEDLFVYAIFLFGFGIILAIGWAIIGNILPTIPYMAQNFTNGTDTIAPLYFQQQVLTSLDWVYLFFTIILAIALFLSAYFLPSHPAFTVVGFIMAMLWLWITPYISNSWISLLSLNLFVGFESNFPFVTTVLVKLPVFGFFIGIIASIIFYGKPPSRSYQGG